MNIEFNCKNISSYDAEKGEYVYCENTLTAHREQIGMRIKCSKCQQYAEVPMPSTTTQGTVSDEQAASEPANSDFDILDEQMEQIVAAQSEATAPAPELPAKQPVPFENASKLAPAAVAMNQAPAAAGTFPSSGQLQYDSFDQSRLCPLCGSLLKHTGVCTMCKYGHRRGEQRQQMPVAMMEMKPAGFTGWIQSKLASDISIQKFVLIVNLLMGSFAVFFGLGAIVIGRSAGLLICMLLAPFFIAFFLGTTFWAKQNSKPMVPLAFWQKPIWNIVLTTGRSKNWGRPKEKIIEMKDKQLADQQLLQLPNISNAEVLDFENTQITDVGLGRIHGLKRARVIVIRGNDVSEEAVFRLQQALPKAWIWH